MAAAAAPLPIPLAQRLLFWGWAGLWLLAIAAASFAGEMSGHFRGASIELRPFMQVYTAALALAQIACLVPLVAGSLLLDGGRAARAAAVAFAAALIGWAVLAAFGLLFGAGPFAPSSWPIRVLRLLVFAPCLLRGAGALLLSSLVATRARATHFARILVQGLWLVDLELCGWCWWVTPHAVVARVHPMETWWPAMLPWWVGGALFLWLLTRRPSPASN